MSQGSVWGCPRQHRPSWHSHRAQPGSVQLQVGEARLYLHSAAYELLSPGSWQLQPDLSRLHLDSSWLLASSNESFNTVLPTCPTLGLAEAVRAAIYLHQHLHQPRQPVPNTLIIYPEFATFQVDTSCFAFAAHARVLDSDWNSLANLQHKYQQYAL